MVHPGALGGALLVTATLLAWPPQGRSALPSSPVPGTGATERRPGRRAATDGDAGLPAPIVLELMCAALEAGLPTGSALRAALAVAGSEFDGHALLAAAPGRRTAAATPQWAPLARALDLADRTGASAAVLLRSAAADERARRRAAVRLSSGRLGVRLVLPLGLTVLPAFVLLGVAPVVLGLADQVLSSP
ncbi:hypothetical protein GCM10023145_12630 [Angustibacter luteus]